MLVCCSLMLFLPLSNVLWLCRPAVLWHSPHWRLCFDYTGLLFSDAFPRPDFSKMLFLPLNFGLWLCWSSIFWHEFSKACYFLAFFFFYSSIEFFDDAYLISDVPPPPPNAYAHTFTLQASRFVTLFLAGSLFSARGPFRTTSFPKCLQTLTPASGPRRVWL